MAEYIKRDWLMKERHGCNRKCAECDFAQDGDSWCEGELFIVDVLRAPAADVVEVRHGRWKLGICQECLFDWSEVSLYANVPNYCPSCGAKMDGGQDEWAS